MQNGDSETYRVCCAVAHDHDLGENDAFEVLRDWNRRCDPPWPEGKLREKIRGAIKGAKGVRGSALEFRQSKSGTIVIESLNNVRLALAKLGVGVSFDAFSQKIRVSPYGVLDDSTANQIWVAIDDRFRFRPSKDLLRTVLETEARFYTFHPVLDYLNGLGWDQKPRIDTWLVSYGGAEDSVLCRAIGSIVLIAAVRRVRQPGCKFDELLILQSGQGEGKSTSLRALCPYDAWFSDDLPLGASSKEVIEGPHDRQRLHPRRPRAPWCRSPSLA